MMSGILIKMKVSKVINSIGFEVKIGAGSPRIPNMRLSNRIEGTKRKRNNDIITLRFPTFFHIRVPRPRVNILKKDLKRSVLHNKINGATSIPLFSKLYLVERKMTVIHKMAIMKTASSTAN